MLILWLILSIISFILCLKKANWERENKYCVFSILTGIAIFILILCVWCMTSEVIKSTVIDEKIAMYQEENIKIEKDINIIVADYKQHELEVFEKSEMISPAVLIQLYPELKSDKLVQQQITLYTENNQTIKSLKEKQIDYKVSKWWLYFNL